MATTETVSATPAAKLPPLQSLDIARNATGKEGEEKTITFFSTEVLRGDAKGTQFLCPKVTKDNLLSEIIPWMGIDIVVSKINGFMRIISSGWYEEAKDIATNKDSGEINQDKLREAFVQFASTFSARGESIKILNEQLEEIVTLMSDLNPMEMSGDQFKNKFMEYTSEVKRIQIEIASKRRERKASDKPSTDIE